MKIAYVDDNIENLEVMEMALANDFEFLTFNNEEEFSSIDLSDLASIILDIHMPGKGGFEIFHDIVSSENYNGCPIFFISSDETDESVVQSFQIGAIDFIPRRTSVAEIRARLKSRIEFHAKHKTIIEFDNLRFNPAKLTVYLDDNSINLTFTELKLLNFVLRNYPEIASKEDLFKSVWGNDYALDGTLHTHVSNLNLKLRDWNYEVVAERLKGISLKKK